MKKMSTIDLHRRIYIFVASSWSRIKEQTLLCDLRHNILKGNHSAKKALGLSSLRWML